MDFVVEGAAAFEGCREGDDGLRRGRSSTVLSVDVFDRDELACIGREGGKVFACLDGARRDGVGLLLAERQREDPVVAEAFVVLEIASGDVYAVVIDGDEQAVFAVAVFYTRHLLDRADVIAAVFTIVAMSDIAEGSGADGGERVLPDAGFVRQRIVGMASEDDGVRRLGEGAGGSAIVMAPCPRAVDRVLRMRMLRVEEREVRVELRLVFFHELFDVLVEAPMAADERISLDLLGVDFLKLFMEAEIPCGLAVLHDGFREGLLALLLVTPDVIKAFVVVVAADEDLFDMAAVRRRVVREDFIPRGCEILQLFDEAPVGDVARDHDGIDFLVVEPAERLLPVVGACQRCDMDVADDSEAEFGSADFFGGEKVWRKGGCGGRGDDGFAERTSGQVEHG